jgi:hypothetical protein
MARILSSSSPGADRVGLGGAKRYYQLRVCGQNSTIQSRCTNVPLGSFSTDPAHHGRYPMSASPRSRPNRRGAQYVAMGQQETSAFLPEHPLNASRPLTALISRPQTTAYLSEIPPPDMRLHHLWHFSPQRTTCGGVRSNRQTQFQLDRPPCRQASFLRRKRCMSRCTSRGKYD